MDIFTACVTFISVLLGIAYPLLIQITSDDKYTSEAVLDLYEGNRRNRFFYFNLICSLFFVLLVLLKLPPLFTFDHSFLNIIISKSAKIFLLISTIFLIINFFRIVNLIQTFYRTSRLISFLWNKKEEVLRGNNFRSFEALADILRWSIQTQNSKVARQISDYFSNIFSEYRNNWKKDLHQEKQEGLVFPEIFYGTVYSVIQQGIKEEKNSFKFLEARTSGLTWLIGEFNSPNVSETTYLWMWRNIVLAIENDRLDLVFMHWQSAHQYFQMNLESIRAEYVFNNGKSQITNEDEISFRNRERELFLEFHYSLGGLLYYSGKYDFLFKLFTYTTSQPPQYNLLPNNLDEIFHFFFKFLDPNEQNFPWINNKYYFPNLEGLNAQGLIKSWICKYICILYFRQFNTLTYYTYQKPTEKPALPQKIEDKRLWLENLKYFKKLIEEVLQNDQLLSKLNFQKDLPYVDKLEEIERDIKEDFEYSEKTAIPLDEKIEMFLKSVESYIPPVLSSFKEISNKYEMGKEIETFNITGQANLMEKGAFTDNGIDHLNFHTFLPEQTNRKIKENLSSIFYVNSTVHYILPQEDVFKALNKLDLEAQNFVLIAFGPIDFNYFINNLQVPKLSKEEYGGIKIFHFPVSVRNVGTSLFVLRKEELPWIMFNEISPEIKTLYELTEIDSELKIYSTVSDLNRNVQLREVINEESRGTLKDLEKMVYQSIVFRTTFKFKKEKKIVRIQIKGYFDTDRSTDKVEDIKKF